MTALQIFALAFVALGVVMREWGISRASSGFDGDEHGRAPNERWYALAAASGFPIAVGAASLFIAIACSRC